VVTRIDRALPALALFMILALPGCSGAGTPTATVEPTTSTAFVIEDAGIETNLPAGTYTSRLFEPALAFELGDGWYRRDENSDRAINLRRAPDFTEDVTFISGPDFLQCGTGEVVAKPDASTIVDGLTSSEMLDTTEPVEVPVGDLKGTAIRLNGGGEAVPEEDFGRSNEYGCIVSIGDDPWPAESLWVMMMPDTAMLLILVEDDDTTVIIRGRPDADPDTFYDLVLDVAEHVSLG